MLTKCIVCGKKLIKEKNQNKFCSRQCWNIFQNKKVIKKCENCGKKIEVKRYRKDRINFCSHNCYWEWLKGKPNKSKTKFQKGHIPWNKGRHWTKEERKKISKALPQRFGENAGNWKGGKTRLRAAIMGLKKYKEWRRKVFERDNWTCVKCGARSTKGHKVIIHADHKKPFYKIIAENKIRTTRDALKCKELWKISNGQTLCISCHKQTDSYLVNQYSL